MSQLVLLSSFSPLPRKVWTINEEGTHVPHAGTCTGPFLSLQPLQMHVRLPGSLQLSTENQSRLFSARLQQRGL